MQIDAENELEIIKKWLEVVDPEFRWENSIFDRVTQMIKGSRINIETLFGYFDKGNKGKLTSSEFFKALEKVGIAELTGEEKERLLRAIDFNNDGFVEINEFKRKLSWAGVWARTNEEQLIYVINDAIERANLDLADAFWLIDQDDKGLITKQEFKSTFSHENIAIDKGDLDWFIEFFW